MYFSQNQAKIKTKFSQKTAFKLRYGILTLFILLSPLNAFARTFNPHNIITDEELNDYDSLSKTAIQIFLEKEKSILASYTQTVEGKNLTAAEMIWNVSQKNNVSPKFILTTLEKEQSLVRRTSATQKVFDWACGFGCYNGGCKEKYRGFYNQIEAAAETQAIYRQRANQFSFKVGQTTMTYDGFPVTPQNQATANFYIYTPYVGYSPELGVNAQNGGNRLFWRIWHRWFSSQKFLDGQVVTNGVDYWQIQNNTKKKFISKDLFLKDYKLSDAIFVSQKDLDAYPNGTIIKFSQNSLVKSSASGQIYLIDQNQKRPILTDSALALLSDFRMALANTDITAVAEDDLTDYAVGSSISETSIYPQGKLFRDTNNQIWLIKDGMRYPVDSAVWQINFNSKPTESINSADLETYQLANPIKFKDGTFLYSDGTYYLISLGERMKISDLSVFDRVFGLDKKNNATTVSAASLNIHAAGEVIDYVDDTIADPVITSNPNTNNNSITPISAGTYEATFVNQEPQGINAITGQTQTVTITYKNTGSATWQKGQVWLQLNDQDKTTSTFILPAKIDFLENSVSNGQIATFTFDLTAPTDKNGMIAQEFSLMANAQNPLEINSYAKFILISGKITAPKTTTPTPTTSTSQPTAKIVSHTLPKTIKNTSKPVLVTLKIKNTSGQINWLSKKSALEVYNSDGKASYFYDKKDWIRSNVAAVPINKSTIKPGETGEFKFTLDAKGLKAGTYTLKFKLNLLDKSKASLLDNQASWDYKIQVL